MTADRKLQDEVVAVSRALHDRGWVANHDGNITVRLGPDRYLATPTATSKRAVDRGNLLVVDDQGNKVSGTSRRFSEVNLHLAVYAARTDAHAVVHAHPPYATALACTGATALARPFMPEAVVSIGASVPTVPFAMPGPAAAAALAPFLADVDAVLLANHGVLSWGADLELAYLRMELVEHMARIATLAEATGGVRPLPEAALAPLLAARAKAGLGKAAERAPSSPPPPAAPSGEKDLARIVREELMRALSDTGRP